MRIRYRTLVDRRGRLVWVIRVDWDCERDSELVVESGWTIDQYEHWVLDQLASHWLGAFAERPAD